MNDLLKGGAALRGKVKKSQIGKPLITIITSSFNAAKYLPSTIQSIREQNYKNIQYHNFLAIFQG